MFLEITLENKTSADVPFPVEVLDPKAGFLEVLIRRRTGAPMGLADAARLLGGLDAQALRAFDPQTGRRVKVRLGVSPAAPNRGCLLCFGELEPPHTRPESAKGHISRGVMSDQFADMSTGTGQHRTLR